MGDESWFLRVDGNLRGPFEVTEICDMYSRGEIGANTSLSCNGSDWMELRHFPGFGTSTAIGNQNSSDTIDSSCASKPDAAELPPPPPLPPKGSSSQLPRSTSTSSDWLDKGKRLATEILTDFREMDFRREIIPIDETNLARLAKDGVFWFATLLGIVPLMICTLSQTNAQLTVFAMFFAAVWGVIFRSAILQHNTSWKLLLPAFLFTGLVGSSIAAFVNGYFLGTDSPAAESHFAALAKFVFVVGMNEEFCKVVPVLAYILWRRRSAQPMAVILVGVFSGLGFAAFENLVYSKLVIADALAATQVAGEEGLVVGVQSAVATAMLRSLSLVFCHAVWAGIFAYFLAAAAISARRWVAMFLVGWGITAILHGVYNWLCFVQPTLAAMTAGISFVLFYGYVAKLRCVIESKTDVPKQCKDEVGV